MKVTLDIPKSELDKLINPALVESRIPVIGVTWQHYETLITIFDNNPQLRMSYLEGTLELMTNSPEHEMIKSLIGRLLEIYALEKGIDLYSCGSATFRKQATARGLEPDESYCLGKRQEIPDLAIEVIITSGGIDKLEIYRGLNVQEVWFWEEGNFSLYHLVNSKMGYEKISSSQLLPEIDVNLLAQYVNPSQEPQMVRDYRQAIIASSSN